MWWIAPLLAAGVALVAGMFYTNRQDIKENFESLLRQGFRLSGKLSVRRGEAIAFDDTNQKIAFVTSNGTTTLPYSHIREWKAVPRINMPAQLVIYTSNKDRPLYTFDINVSAMDYVMATMGAHLNSPADD